MRENSIKEAMQGLSYEETCKGIIEHVKELSECMKGVLEAPAERREGKVQDGGQEYDALISSGGGKGIASGTPGFPSGVHGSVIVTEDIKHRHAYSDIHNFTISATCKPDGSLAGFKHINFDTVLDKDFLFGDPLAARTTMFFESANKLNPSRIAFGWSGKWNGFANSILIDCDNNTIGQQTNRIPPKTASDLLKVLKEHRKPLVSLGLIQEKPSQVIKPEIPLN